MSSDSVEISEIFFGNFQQKMLRKDVKENVSFLILLQYLRKNNPNKINFLIPRTVGHEIS